MSGGLSGSQSRKPDPDAYRSALRTLDASPTECIFVDNRRENCRGAEKAGIPRERIIVDPGLGFGKTAAESFELLGRLDEFHALGCPILVGHSHKSMFDHVDRTPDDRLEATVAATALAAGRGADIVRVHDVAENRTAVDVQQATDDPRSE